MGLQSGKVLKLFLGAALLGGFIGLTSMTAAADERGPWPEYQQGVIEAARADGYEEIGLPAPEAKLPDNLTREEKDAGLFVFWRGNLSKIRLRHLPTREEHDRPIAVYGAQGEVASLAVGFHALEELEGVRTSFEFKSSESGNAPGKVEVHHVLPGPVVQRYRRSYIMESLWLVPPNAIKVGEGSSRMVWVNFRIPETAAPGTYQGTVSLLRKDGRSLSQKVSLTILPFVLAETGIRITPCATNAGYSQAVFDQMKDHGIDGLLWFWRGYGLDLRREGAKVIFDPTRMDLTVARMKASKMRGPMIIFGGNDRRDYLALALKDIYPWLELQPMIKRRGKLLEVGRLNDPFLDEKVVEIFRQFLEHAKQMQYPPIMYSPFDEANERLLKEHHYRARLLKKHFPKLVIYGDSQNTLRGAKAMSETIDVFGPNGSFAAVSKLAHQSGKKLWLLTGCKARMRTADVRFNLGLAPYFYRAHGVTFWSYDFYGVRNPYNEFDFTRAAPSWWATAWPALTEGGPMLSTPAYEAVRVAYQDLRYFATLDELLKGNTSAQASAIRDAKKELVRAFVERDEVQTVPATEEVLHITLEDMRIPGKVRQQVTDWILTLKHRKPIFGTQQ